MDGRFSIEALTEEVVVVVAAFEEVDATPTAEVGVVPMVEVGVAPTDEFEVVPFEVEVVLTLEVDIPGLEVEIPTMEVAGAPAEDIEVTPFEEVEGEVEDPTEEAEIPALEVTVAPTAEVEAPAEAVEVVVADENMYLIVVFLSLSALKFRNPNPHSLMHTPNWKSGKTCLNLSGVCLYIW